MTSLSYKKMEPEKILQAHDYLPSLWVKGMVNESGHPLEFENHRFLVDIYNDLSPLQVLLKPPQIGATVMKVLKALYVASHYSKQIIYTLPTQSDVYEMVGGSFNRIIAQNQELKDLVRDSDTMEHKAVGDGLIRFRGTFTSKQAMMVPSDLNIHDEVDASDAAIITQYETRLQSKADGMRWYFSHPSISGHGVDVYWQQSDKKEWFVTCESCKKPQVLRWPESIDSILEQYVCATCHAPLSDEVRRMGEWQPTSTGKFSGYHLSQLMCPWITAKAILESKADPMKDEQYFYNYVLGLPYVESLDKVSSSQVLRNVVPEINTQEGNIIIGVDTGLPIYFVCLNKQGVFYHGTCPKDDPYAFLESLLKKWPRATIVSDQGGDLIGIRQLQQKYPSRVFLAYYRRDRKTGDLTHWNDDGSLVIDRNRMITLLVDQLRDIGRIRFNGQTTDWEAFAKHFDNIMRLKEETPFGMEYRWERNGPDHYVHTLVYALAGLDRFGEQEATIISNGDWMKDIPTARMFDI